ncbi:MAG: AI-2E family transporter [Bacteroidota bacterium]
MTNQSHAPEGVRILVIVAALVIIIYGVNQAQSMIALFLVSTFLALIATPAVLLLERKRVPSFLAVMIVIATIVTLLLFISGIVFTSINNFAETLPFYQKRFQEEVVGLTELLASKNIIVTEKVLLEYLNPGSVLSLTAGFLTGMGVAFSNMILILLTLVFILLEASSFSVKLRSVLGDPQRVFPNFTKFLNDMKTYMVIKTVISLAAGVILGIWLYILGVDSPVLWGFVAFLLHYIPNLGHILAAIPPVLLALIQLGMGPALLVAGGYLVVGFTLGNVVEPRFMGRKLGLSTLVVFLSLIVWGALLGPVGIILCVPLTMTMKFAFESNPETRWISVMLGSEKASESIPVVPAVPAKKNRTRKRSSPFPSDKD